MNYGNFNVNFEEISGQFMVGGRLIDENLQEILEPYKIRFLEYSRNPRETTDFSVEIEYFNTSASRILVDIFHMLESIHQSGNKVNLTWKYEEDDEDMKDAGEDFESMVSFDFEYVSVEDY